MTSNAVLNRIDNPTGEAATGECLPRLQTISRLHRSEWLITVKDEARVSLAEFISSLANKCAHRILTCLETTPFPIARQRNLPLHAKFTILKAFSYEAPTNFKPKLHEQ